eukprot:TRINITY_DN24987_c0_g1_i4.p1 TRINITY_DN24987_c0_g1~~TRINITY_DN24987_c0_g1_i4.p1  ORF type:complete len:1058 (-),score=195.10 TRINITY_DN24987_c0_g1_i4:85-3258(-)
MASQRQEVAAQSKGTKRKRQDEDASPLPLEAALAASADKAPKRAEVLCAYDVSARLWLSPQQVERLPKNRHLMLLHGYEYQVSKARKSTMVCKRCGHNLEKMRIMVGYPTIVSKESSRSPPEAKQVWLHLRCAATQSNNDISGGIHQELGSNRSSNNRKQLKTTTAAGGRRCTSEAMQTSRLKEIAAEGDKAMRRLVLGYDALPRQERQWLIDEVLRDDDDTDREEPIMPSVPAKKQLKAAADDLQANALTVRLLPFQAEGVAWMLSQEKDEQFRGGVLADEMGMGKTLQMIATILASDRSEPTLVVATASGIMQWRSEIHRFARQGSVKVDLYFGPERKKRSLSDLLEAADPESQGPRKIILTSYQTLEADYRREVNKHKLQCKWCGRRFTPQRLTVHLKYFCGPQERRSDKTCPSEAPAALTRRGRELLTAIEDAEERAAELDEEPDVASGETEVAGEEPSAAHGEARDGADVAASAGMQMQALEDAVIFESATSWKDAGTLKAGQTVTLTGACVDEGGYRMVPIAPSGAVELCKLARLQANEAPTTSGPIDLSNSPLHRQRWGRVVLDEAHRIKGRSSTTAQAALALRACHARWCITGTPVQNRIGELYPIIQFLRFYPYGYSRCWKRGCDCEVLFCGSHEDNAAGTLCSKCGHGRSQHRSIFASDIANPIKQFGFLGRGREAMEKLRHEVLDKLLLRRTKAERSLDVNLPPLKVSVQRCDMRPKEAKFYGLVEDYCMAEYKKYENQGTVMNNFGHIFGLISRRRQAADHPHLVKYSAAACRGQAERLCAVCQEHVPLEDPTVAVVARCGHAFHADCARAYADEAPHTASEEATSAIAADCPMCHLANIASDDARAQRPLQAPRATPSLLDRIQKADGKVRSSGKVEAMVSKLDAILAKDDTAKVLVFSQFTTFLEIIAWRLKLQGLTQASLVGTMSAEERHRACLRFQSDEQLKVLLVSLKAGGEGLNLQAANYVFLMDPWWNPAQELQAIQRAHRIGQTRKVRAIRFVSSGTIEEKMLQLQDKKQCVFDCTVGGNNLALTKLTGEDIQFLFS